MDKGHWEYPYEFNIDDWFGFIYRIIEVSTGKEYVGKKQFHQHLSKRVPNRKNKIRFKKESDWKKYTGSSKKLNEAIETNGKENYRFLIESLHKSKGSLHYREVETQITENVLREKLPSGERKYYNGHIDGVKFLPPDEVSEETCMKIKKGLQQFFESPEAAERNRKVSAGVKTFYEDNPHYLDLMSVEDRDAFLNQHKRGENNPMFGKEPHNKGLSMEESYGVEEAEHIRQILRESCPRYGEDNGMFERTHSDEQKEKWKTDERRIHRGEDNGMYGKPCHFKMTEEEKESWKKNVGLSQKGVPKPKTTCPHCLREIANNLFARYHGDNCKENPNRKKFS